MKLTSAQMLIAAAMCEARKVELKHESTEDEIEAADLVNVVRLVTIKANIGDSAMTRARLSLKYGVPLVLILAGGYQVGRWFGWW